MKKNLLYKSIEPVESLQVFVEKKFAFLDKLVAKLDPEDGATLHVELARTTRHHSKGDVFYAEANLVLPGKSFRATQKGENLRAAITDVREKLKESVEKYKEKKVSAKRNNS